MIEIKNVKKSYGKKEILNNVSLMCEKGCIVGIIGKNGCGKSTLLSIMAGTLKADEGQICYFGEDAQKNKNVFAQYVGYVPQENPLILELSAKDNLKLWYADSKRNLEQDIKEGILFDLGIGAFLKKKIRHLSGGMKKKVSIACAVAKDAAILILDEPGAALDLPSKEDIRKYLRKFADDGGIVLLTSHEEAEFAICDVIYALKDGVLCEVTKDMSAKEMVEKYF
ncbi:MAG: ATP-binding cassette domain-containing protein [Lachnospiraceae bacterium]|nr:ATP-binding cassette domain-containing protein [Lachnospiraceae bacterium]